MKQGTELAEGYAQYFNLEPRQDGESERDFRGRISGWLRDNGHVIEAHEAFQNERYEDSENVMTGLFGAAAQALQGVDYGSHGERQIDDDFVAGIMAQEPEDDADALDAQLYQGRHPGQLYA